MPCYRRRGWEDSDIDRGVGIGLARDELTAHYCWDHSTIDEQPEACHAIAAAARIARICLCDSSLDNDALVMHNSLVDQQTHKSSMPTPVHARPKLLPTMPPCSLDRASK